jgi:transcriptional regulator with XRE-family HTH domain
MEKSEMTPKSFGETVKQAREAKKLSQVDLANICGIHQPTISKLEKGHKVGANAIDKILKALDIEDLPLSFPRRFIK